MHSDPQINPRSDMRIQLIAGDHAEVLFHEMPLSVHYDYTPGERSTRLEPGVPAECIVEKVLIGDVDVTYMFDANEDMRIDLENQLIEMRGDL